MGEKNELRKTPARAVEEGGEEGRADTKYQGPEVLALSGPMSHLYVFQMQLMPFCSRPTLFAYR